MRRSRLSGRRVGAGLCAALSVVALAAGAILLYLRVELLDEDGFADRAVEAVRDPQVRSTLADRIVSAAIEVEPDLLSARPLLESAARGAIDTPAFEGLVRAAAINAHRLLFDAEEPTIAVDVADAAELILPAVRSGGPPPPPRRPPPGPRAAGGGGRGGPGPARARPRRARRHSPRRGTHPRPGERGDRRRLGRAPRTPPDRRPRHGDRRARDRPARVAARRTPAGAARGRRALALRHAARTHGPGPPRDRPPRGGSAGGDRRLRGRPGGRVRPPRRAGRVGVGGPDRRGCGTGAGTAGRPPLPRLRRLPAA